MSIEEGVVKKISGNRVLIVADAKQACHNCDVKKSCMISADKLKRELWAQTKIPLDLNDKVKFEVHSQAVILSSIIIYLLPLVFLFLGSLAGYLYHENISMPDELASALLGILSFLFSFLVVKFISKKLVKRNKFRPVIIKKIK